MPEKADIEAWMMTASLEDLQGVIGTYNTALKFARERAAQQVKMNLSVGDPVHFHNSRRNCNMNGTVTKIMRKNCLIKADFPSGGIWRVPMGNVNAGHVE